MTAGGFLRFFVSGVLILAAITVIQRADAASSTDDDSVCVAEATACDQDDVCHSCTTDYDGTVYEECVTGLLSDIAVSSASTSCGFQTAALTCCQDEASEESCMDNDEFVDYLQCLMLDGGCSMDDDSCSGILSADDSKAARTRKSSSIVLAFVLGLAAAVGMMT